MFRNYLVSALRNLKKQKLYTLLNIFGFALGLSSFVLIYMYIQFELSYDKHHENYDRIYKVIKQDPGNFYMGTNIFRVTPIPLAGTLMSEYPEVEYATKLYRRGNALIRTEEDVYYDENWIWADKHVFDVFTIPLLIGDPATALNDPYSVVVCETYANKYFGNENPIGKVLNFNNDKDYVITAVMKDFPQNSHFKANFIANFEALRDTGRSFDRWGNNSYHTYFLMKEGHDYKELEAKFPALIDKYAGDNIWEHHGEKTIYLIEKLGDIHLRSVGIFYINTQGEIKYVYIFAAIAAFILLIACVNYMNLATVQSLRRAKEVGIRKVVGAFRPQLIRQFIGESVFQTVISFMLALLFVYLLMPAFRDLVQREIEFSLLLNAGFLLPLALTVLLIGLFAGIYPAIMASSFAPVTMLKGALKNSRKGIALRNILVVTQFSISIFLILSTLIVGEQMSMIRNKKLGYDRDHIVYFYARGDRIRDSRDIIKTELLQDPNVLGVTVSSHSPMRISSSSMAHFEGRAEEEDKLPTYRAYVDYDYFDLFNIELVQGRPFSPEIASDSTAYIINEMTAKRLGWEDPIGKEFGFSRRTGQVIGIVKDFNFTSLHLPIEPMALSLDPKRGSRIHVKIRPENVTGTITNIENIWDKYTDGYPINYEFMDEAYDQMYRAEIRLWTIFKYFAGLAIVICCLGLFGLASFTAEQSTKEIGIRKVLGAAASDIVGMLSWQFTKWVLYANIIAWPAGYYAMNFWLKNFEYRITPGIEIFLAAGMSALLIAAATISLQTVRAARRNPVEALRHE